MEKGQHGSAYFEPRNQVAVVILHWLIRLIGRVGDTLVARNGTRPIIVGSAAVGVIDGVFAGAGIQSLVLKLSEDGAVILRRALLHDDVHDAAECAAKFCCNTRALDLDLINEVHRYIGVGIAADDVGCFLALHQIGVLGVGTTSDRISETAAVTAVAGRNASGAISGGVAHQRFVAGCRRELNHRLERPPDRDVFEDLIGDVGLRGYRGCVDFRCFFRIHLNYRAHCADLHGQVDCGQVANLEHQAVALERLESLCLNLDGVRAGRQVREAVVSRPVRFDDLGADHCRRGNRNRSPGHNGAGRILYRALQATGGFLAIGGRLLRCNDESQCKRKRKHESNAL